MCIVCHPSYKHECPEMDYMLIDEYDKEFSVCICFIGDPVADRFRLDREQDNAELGE